MMVKCEAKKIGVPEKDLKRPTNISCLSSIHDVLIPITSFYASCSGRAIDHTAAQHSGKAL